MPGSKEAGNRRRVRQKPDDMIGRLCGSERDPRILATQIIEKA